MELFAKALLVLIPSIFVLFFLEMGYAYFRGRFEYRIMDVISSLSAGMTNAIKSVLGLTIVIFGYKYMYEHLALTEIKTTWLVYFLSFVALDFGSYWYHRLAHHVNIFWNRHVIHHSGEDFNIATALRQSISKFVNISVFFLLPAALLGLPPKVIAIVTPLHLFLQVWYHTTQIGKLGWLEYILVTPSQHRVHHAINPIYRDKNLSGVFCIWDRLFGTFQEELEEEPCVYGVTRQVNTWNPIRINLNHIWLLTKDAWRAENWKDKFRIWLMPTGWRPADVAAKYPIASAKTDAFVKYAPDTSQALKYWSLIQYVLVNLMVFQLLYQFTTIGSPGIFIYGAFMYLMIYSYTSLMDKDPNAIWMEIVKSSIGIAILLITGDWFKINELSPFGSSFILIYHVISPIIVSRFVVREIGWNGKDNILKKAEA